jgi:hypothetical protein
MADEDVEAWAQRLAVDSLKAGEAEYGKPADQPDPRREIEAFMPALSAREERLVRWGLETIDAEHRLEGAVGIADEQWCNCGSPWPCGFKAEHEARLLEAIRNG